MNTNAFFLALFAFVLLATEVLATGNKTTVTLDGRTILVNNRPFFGRGIGYGVVPLGQWPDSFNVSFGWDWQSSPAVYNRDLANIQEMNGNVIRTYGWRHNLRHDAFLDECYRRGIYVIIGWNWSWSRYGTSAGKQQMRDEVKLMVRNHADHPAVLAWAVGNELNGGGRGYQPAVWDFIAELTDIVHTEEANMSTWHPVSSPLCDGDSMWQIINARNNVTDLWMLQLYRGTTFWDFWTRYNASSTKPLLITEFGVDSYVANATREEGEKLQADWEIAMWNEIDLWRSVCSGALLFQYADGYYKCGGNTSRFVQDLCSSNGGTRFPGGQVNEEYFGIFSINNTELVGDGNDTLRPKEAYCRFRTRWADYERWVPYEQQMTLCNKFEAPVTGTPSKSATIFGNIDSYVRGGTYGSNNYGNDINLAVKYASSASFLRESYLRFDFVNYKNQTNPITSAELVLNINTIDRNVDFPFSIAVVRSDWTESTVTYNVKPAQLSVYGNFVRQTGVNTLSLDITDLVNPLVYGNGSETRLSLRIYKTSGTDELCNFFSTQASPASLRPQVIISSPTLKL